MNTYITDTYALKYYGECCNYRKQRSRVEIWAKGTVGSSYPRAIGDITALSLAINGNEDIDAPIVKTILNLSMADTWDEAQVSAAYATKHGAWEEFYTPDSTAYLVKLFTAEDGDINWTHRWSGYITPDNWQETIGYRGSVGIVARDNLGHLQDFDFDLDGDANGLVSAYDIIDGAFAKIAFPMSVDIGTAESGSRKILLETGAASGSRGLFDACLAVENFKGDSWESVLQDVLDALGLTIRFVDNNTVAVTYIRNLPLCGQSGTPDAQTIEFYGNGTRLLVPAYKDVKIETSFDYQQDVTFTGKVVGAYGLNESYHWLYFDERRQQAVTGDAFRCDVGQVGRGWFANDKAFVNPSSYFITKRGGGAAIVDTDTTALLIANATDETVQAAAAGYTFGKVNTPAAVVSLEVTASFTLSGRYLLRSGSLISYEWAAFYIVGNDVYRWNGSQWKTTAEVWTETTENKMDFSAPMNLRDMDEGGTLTVFIRNIKATTGFCIGVEGMKMECNDPSTSLKSDTVTVVNNSAFNVRAKRTPKFGFLSKEVVWNVIGNYPNVFWKVASGNINPWPYQSVWSDGTENLAVPVQWAKQTLMFHHSTLQQIEGEVGVINGGMWWFDRPALYKGHYFLQQGGTWDLLSGHVTGLSLREYLDYATLWAGAATVAPQVTAFPQAGGSVSFLITCAEDKEWDVTGLPDWLTASVERGVGSGTVTITAEVNDYGSRTRTFYIAGVAIHASQAQRNFDLYFEPASIDVTADGRSMYVTVQASNDAAWKLVSSDEDWILVNGLDEWEDTGYDDAVSILVQVNETGSERNGYLSLYDGEDNLVQTIPVHQGTESGGGGGGDDLTLTISTNVESPTIVLQINGVTTAYTAGMVVAPGAQVSVAISKSGYSTTTDSFTMSAATTARYYALEQSIKATVSYPYAISQSAQNVQVNVSDPGNHGWTLDYDSESYFGYITGGAVVSGNATLSDKVFTGTGNAVLTLAVSANPYTYDRTVGSDMAPIYFYDNTLGYSSSWVSIRFTQLGTSSSQVSVTSITLNKNSTSIAAGLSETLVATVNPSNATNKTLTWSTSNSAVATVDQNGTVYAVGTGSATITARSTDGSNKSATCTVTVTGSSVAVSGVSLNKASLALNVGGTSQLAATVTPSNATNKNVTWASSDTSIATVSSAGLVTAVATGTATITVTTVDGGKTATCSVTVTSSGSLSAEDVTAKSQATSASSVLTTTNIQPATLAASCSESWVTGVTVDRSSTPYRVRLQFQANSSSSSRSATVTVTGKDVSGVTKTTTFTLTQNGKSTSETPCTALAMNGVADIHNSDNLADYFVDFTPSATTQNKVVWTVTDRSGNATSYAQIETASDNRCSVKVLSGANNAQLRVKATNYYNSSVYVTKDITATYVAPASGGHIQVSESYIEIPADSTFDDSITVSLVNMRSTLATLLETVSGFITSADVDQYGRVNIVFPVNNSSEARSGSVTLTGTNTDDETVSTIITYYQLGKAGTAYGFEIMALQVTGTTQARFAVDFFNETSASKVVRNLSYSLVGYNSQSAVTLRASGTLNDRAIAALATEEEIYTIGIELLGPTTTYVLTITSDVMTDTFEGDGTDPI